MSILIHPVDRAQGDGHALHLTVEWSVECETNEYVTSLAHFNRTVNGKEVTYACVGFTVFPVRDNMPVTGRLRLYANSGDAGLVPLTSADTVGPVYAIKVVNDKLVVAVESVVRLFVRHLSLLLIFVP